MSCHEEQVEGGPAQKEDESGSESTELAEMLLGLPRTPQSLVPDAYKPLLPWALALPRVLPTNSLYCLHQLQSVSVTPRRTSTGTLLISQMKTTGAEGPACPGQH